MKWRFNVLIPFFQVNTKFLAPLFLAYDDRLKEKEQLIRTYDVSLFEASLTRGRTKTGYRGIDWT